VTSSDSGGLAESNSPDEVIQTMECFRNFRGTRLCAECSDLRRYSTGRNDCKLLSECFRPLGVSNLGGFAVSFISVRAFVIGAGMWVLSPIPLPSGSRLKTPCSDPAAQVQCRGHFSECTALGQHTTHIFGRGHGAGRHASDSRGLFHTVQRFTETEITLNQR
jgi:hypothetical protein